VIKGKKTTSQYRKLLASQYSNYLIGIVITSIKELTRVVSGLGPRPAVPDAMLEWTIIFNMDFGTIHTNTSTTNRILRE
jgi:hypothetical protein